MTNLLAAVLVTVSTNWQTVGTFYPVIGSPEEVQRGTIQTNVTAVFDWQGAKHEVLLQSSQGPSCGERRVPVLTMGVIWGTNQLRAIWMTNTIGL